MAKFLSRSLSRLRHTTILQTCETAKVLTRYFSKMKGLVLGVYTEKSADETNPSREVSEVTKAFKDVDTKTNGALSGILKATGPFYQSAKQKLLWASLLKTQNLDFDCISVVDLGSKDARDNPLELINQKSENIRCAITAGVLALDNSSKYDDIYLDSCGSAQNVSEGAILALYRYDELKTKTKAKSNLHLYEFPTIEPESKESYKTGVTLANCQNFARTLAQTPANFMTPSIFASKVEEAFKNTKTKVIVRDLEWIESMKMGSFLSVTRGSDEKPKFVEIHYEGLPGVEENIALVGKGITFDSGGISLKPALDMDKMRADMGGAATVVGVMLAVASLDLKINIKGFIPLAENMPSGRATKPGDVVRAMNGKTIQVHNTDAEGRLVLADSILYAHQFKPKAIIDIATLTGAVKVALGTITSAVYSNDDELWDTILKASYVTGDRVWRMPLFSFYSECNKADLADINNLGRPQASGGSCTAAAFLKEFVQPDMKWMHLDIAGVVECHGEAPYNCSVNGMSGRPTRTLVQFLKDFSESKA